MKNTISIKPDFKIFTKAALVGFGIFILIFMLLKFPEAAAQGASDGIDLSLGTLIPTLYPFLVVSSLITETNITDKLTAPFAKLTKVIFNLDSKCLSAIALSMIGGMPVGCKMASELYENGSISLSQSRRMMLFCFCCGPAFTISSVGMYMLASKSAGIIMYASIITANIIVGILSRLFEDENFTYHTATKKAEDKTFSDSLVKSVSSGTMAIVSICSWVVLFSCINRIIEILPFSDTANFSVNCILEVTNACKITAGYIKLPLIAGIISFGGLCSHCQVMPYLVKVRMKYKHFLVSRIICGALSVIICNLLLEIFPVAYDVFSMGTLPSETTTANSVSISVAMMFMAGIVLIGDNTVIRMKTKTDHRN